jgi:hypothetical protein
MGKQSCLLFSRNWLLWCIIKLFIMADITCCPGTNCPVKEKCYRFTAPKSEFMQSYFFEAPGKTEDDKFTCDMYWGENNEFIWNQLKNIVNGKDNSGV